MPGLKGKVVKEHGGVLSVKLPVGTADFEPQDLKRVDKDAKDPLGVGENVIMTNSWRDPAQSGPARIVEVTSGQREKPGTIIVSAIGTGWRECISPSVRLPALFQGPEITPSKRGFNPLIFMVLCPNQPLPG